jgi:hypothetical protein
MRMKHLVQFGLPTVLALALGLTTGWTQQPGGGPPGGFPGGGGGFPGGGGGRGKGGGGFDPGKMFDFVANGRASIPITELARGRDPSQLQQWAAQNGVTNGELTRDQFAQYMEARMAERRANGGGRGFGGPRGAGPGGGPPPAAAPSLAPQGAPPSPDGGAAPAPGGAPDGSAPQSTPADEEEKRPVVHRPGKLPKGLPAWFAQMDTDNDGQVGLYEWKASGRSLDEFRKLDRNGDGFITVEEALHSVKATAVASGNGGNGGNGNSPGRSGDDAGEESSSGRVMTRVSPANMTPNAAPTDGGQPDRQSRRQGRGFGKQGGGFGKQGGGRRDRSQGGDGQGEQRRGNNGGN